jgi:hypothetical protein
MTTLQDRPFNSLYLFFDSDDREGVRCFVDGFSLTPFVLPAIAARRVSKMVFSKTQNLSGLATGKA